MLIIESIVVVVVMWLLFWESGEPKRFTKEDARKHIDKHLEKCRKERLVK